MEFKENLTNESLGNKFKSQFELVNYAIKLAENMIKTGRAPRVSVDIENTALQVVAEIAENRDVLEEIPDLDVDIEEEILVNGKFTEEKGSRKAEGLGKKSKAIKIKLEEDDE